MGGFGEWTSVVSGIGSYSLVPSQGATYYEIYLNGATTGKVIAYGTLLVIPELPLGSLLALGTMIGAVPMMKRPRKLG